MWTKILEIDEDFFQIRNDDDAYNFDVYAYATQVDGDIFVEYDVNGVTSMEGIDDEVIEGLDDSEDDRATTLVDGFDGFYVIVLINHWDIVAGLLGRPKKKIEDGEYFSDELDGLDPHESDDDEGLRFKRFRKEQLNKDYKFK